VRLGQQLRELPRRRCDLFLGIAHNRILSTTSISDSTVTT
jgi:hypothetical protein